MFLINKPMFLASVFHYLLKSKQKTEIEFSDGRCVVVSHSTNEMPLLQLRIFHDFLQYAT
jgi:hypothetical protein